MNENAFYKFVTKYLNLLRVFAQLRTFFRAHFWHGRSKLYNHSNSLWIFEPRSDLHGLFLKNSLPSSVPLFNSRHYLPFNSQMYALERSKVMGSFWHNFLVASKCEGPETACKQFRTKNKIFSCNIYSWMTRMRLKWIDFQSAWKIWISKLNTVFKCMAKMTAEGGQSVCQTNLKICKVKSYKLQWKSFYFSSLSPKYFPKDSNWKR